MTIICPACTKKGRGGRVDRQHRIGRQWHSNRTWKRVFWRVFWQRKRWRYWSWNPGEERGLWPCVVCTSPRETGMVGDITESMIRGWGMIMAAVTIIGVTAMPGFAIWSRGTRHHSITDSLMKRCGTPWDLDNWACSKGIYLLVGVKSRRRSMSRVLTAKMIAVEFSSILSGIILLGSLHASEDEKANDPDDSKADNCEYSSY